VHVFQVFFPICLACKFSKYFSNMVRPANAEYQHGKRLTFYKKQTLKPINILGRNPQTSDHLVVSKIDLNVGLYAWSPVRCSVRSTNSTTLCSFVLQTLRCSVRLLNKNERFFCTFDLHLNDVMISTIESST